MRFETDKFENGLINEYLAILQPLQYKPVRLLEIGVFRGGSIKFWSHYLKHPETRIIGLDITLPQAQFAANVSLLECDQNDGNRLAEIAAGHGPFDLIIDDGTHFRRETENCFRTLFGHVVPGGYYVIEDWAVGYWHTRPQYAGMVQLVTEIMENAPDLQIEGFSIVLETNKAMALFRRGHAGWSQ